MINVYNLSPAQVFVKAEKLCASFLELNNLPVPTSEIRCCIPRALQRGLTVAGPTTQEEVSEAGTSKTKDWCG